MITTFNKIDIMPHGFAMDWMSDYEKFQEALDAQRDSVGYMGSLVNSMSLVLDEFYSHLEKTGISALTGAGVEEFFEAVDRARIQYEEQYLPHLLQNIEKRKRIEAKRQGKEMANMVKDMKIKN